MKFHGFHIALFERGATANDFIGNAINILKANIRFVVYRNDDY